MEVNPRDVVAVPSDCEFAKMRVAQYRVLGVGTARCAAPLFEVAPEGCDDKDDFEDECWEEAA